jgi:hypothetical protein
VNRKINEFNNLSVPSVEDDWEPEVKPSAKFEQMIGFGPGPSVHHQVVVILRIAERGELKLLVESDKNKLFSFLKVLYIVCKKLIGHFCYISHDQIIVML